MSARGVTGQTFPLVLVGALVGCAAGTAHGPGSPRGPSSARTAAREREGDSWKAARRAALDRRWRAAEELFRRGETERAVAAFSRIAQDTAGAAATQAYEFRAQCHSAAGRHQAALADVNRSLSGARDRVRARRLAFRARVHFDLGDARSMARDYAESLATAPLALTYNSRGGFFLDAGEAREAIADFDAALALEPDDDERYIALLNRSMAYWELAELDAAERDATEVIRLWPDEDTGWRLRGSVRFDKRLWWAAVGDFVEALARLPASDRAVAPLKRLALEALERHEQQSM